MDILSGEILEWLEYTDEKEFKNQVSYYKDDFLGKRILEEILLTSY